MFDWLSVNKCRSVLRTLKAEEQALTQLKYNAKSRITAYILISHIQSTGIIHPIITRKRHKANISIYPTNWPGVLAFG